MLGRLLCRLGLHKEQVLRWQYDLGTGEPTLKVVACGRPRCGWWLR